MTKFIIRRLIQAIPTFFGITLLSYMIMLASPSDPVALMTNDPSFSQQEKAAMAARMGINDPWPLQYFRWLVGDDWLRWDSDGDGIADRSFLIALDSDGDGVPEPPGDRRGILRGDFGKSFSFREDSLKLIGQFLPATLELNVIVLIVSLALGIPIGILAAVWRGGAFDNGSRIIAVIGDAIPVFWLGIILIIVFGSGGQWLDILPMGGRCGVTRGDCPPVYLRLEYLVLPTLVLALGGVAGYSRYMRAAMLETISSDYVRTARAKGLTTQAVWFKHGFRNAMIPLATFLGPTITGLLGGSAITETIFSWPGVGRLLVRATTSLDYPLVMAGVVVGAVLTIIGYLLSDILYAVFDPRIRF